MRGWSLSVEGQFEKRDTSSEISLEGRRQSLLDIKENVRKENKYAIKSQSLTKNLG